MTPQSGDRVPYHLASKLGETAHHRVPDTPVETLSESEMYQREQGTSWFSLVSLTTSLSSKPDISGTRVDVPGNSGGWRYVSYDTEGTPEEDRKPVSRVSVKERG